MFQSLDLIFEDNYEDAFKDDSPLLGAKIEKKPAILTQEKKVGNDVKKKSKNSIRKSTRKSFSTSMSFLFEGPKAVEDTATVEKPKDARLAGIDLLIKGTLEGSKRIVENVAPQKKRVTFIIDKEKLAKIKGIAKSEKAYIKDIFDRVVSDYLKKEGLL